MYLKIKNLTNWRFWYKFFGVAMVITFIILDYGHIINTMRNATLETGFTGWEIFGPGEELLVLGQDFLGFTLFYMGYFTFQTNIFVLVWFITSIVKFNFKPNIKGHKSFILSRTSTLMITVFITITGIIFNAVLLPVGLSGAETIDVWNMIIVQEIGHGIVPLMMLLYTLFCDNRIYQKTNWSRFFARDISIGIVYLIIYLTFGLIRGGIVYASLEGVNLVIDGQTINGANEYISHFNIRAYQYFFLNVNDPLGQIMLPITVVSIIAIIMGIGCWLHISMNRHSWKLSDPTNYKTAMAEMKTSKTKEKIEKKQQKALNKKEKIKKQED